MNKSLIGTLAVLAIVAGSAGTASAHGISAGADVKAGASVSRDDGRKGEVRGGADAGFRASLGRFLGFSRNDDDAERRIEERNHKALVGTAEVVRIDGGTIVAEDRDGATWNVETDSDTRFVLRGEQDAELSDIAVGDRIGFTGSVTSSGDERTVDARLVSDWMLHAGKDGKSRAAGTVESVDADNGTIVLDTKHRGDVTVSVDSDTEIRTEDGDGDGVFADIMVGAKVYVKGILDSFADIMTATKARIMDRS